MGAWFFLAAALALASPQGSGTPAAPPIVGPAAVAIAPLPSDADIEQFLKEAKVVRTKDAAAR